MDSDSHDAAIVRSIITLGHDLKLEVVAEGVETEAAYDRLAPLGCDVDPGILAESPASAGRAEPLARGLGQRGEPRQPRRTLAGGYFPIPAVSPRTKNRCPER